MKKFLVKVVTKSSKLSVTQTGNKNLLVKLTAIPFRNKANLQLIEVLAKYFHVPKSAICIKGGLRSKIKIVIVDDVD